MLLLDKYTGIYASLNTKLQYSKHALALLYYLMQEKTKCKVEHTYICIYTHIQKYKCINKHAIRYNKVNICILNLYIHLNTCKYGCIQLYIPIYAAFRCPRGVRDLFTTHLHPVSRCALHQADTAMVQHHPTSTQMAVAPAQLPCHMVTQ